MKVIVLYVVWITLITAATINIPLDFSTIQEGIDATVDGDTVLVLPGVYNENINFLGREITVASYHLLFQIDTLIDSTVIDGGMTDDRVVRISDHIGPYALLHGFTIRNGRGGILVSNWSEPTLRHLIIHQNNAESYGGGIHISSSVGGRIEQVEVYDNECDGHECAGGGIAVHNSDIILENVVIHHNQVPDGIGGGMRIAYSDVFLRNVKIHNNTATGDGGGIYIYDSDLTFDGLSVHHNRGWQGGGICIRTGSSLNSEDVDIFSVYCNYGRHGRDFFTDIPISIALDTATVTIPTAYHAWPIDQFTFSVNVGMHQQHAANLYVSPQGNDDNTGTTWVDPLRTIDRALCTIIPATPTPRIIHLAAGLHLAEETGEIYPLGWISGVSLYGQSSAETILDAQETHRLFNIRHMENASIRQMTLRQGRANRGGALLITGAEIELQDLIIVNNTATNDGGGAISANAGTFQLTDVIMANNNSIGGKALHITGGAVNLLNCLVRGNSGGGIFNHSNTQLNLSNTILWDNPPHQLHTVQSGSSVTFQYCDVQGGPEYIHGINDHVDWGEGNINSNPLFCHPDSLRQVAENSPCLDSGFQGMNIGQVFSACDPIAPYDGTRYYIANFGSDLLGDGTELSPFQSFARAINQAADGDTIIVEQGQYFEPIDPLQKNLLITSRIIDGYDEDIVLNTILDGSNSPGMPMVILDGDYTTASGLQGFTIQNSIGDDDAGSCYPGAILVGGSAESHLTRLWIRDNTSTCAYPLGAVLVKDFATPTAERVIFTGNNAASEAGAMTVKNSASAQLVHVTAYANSVTAPGFSIRNSASVFVENSIIQDSIYAPGNDALTARYSNFPYMIPGPGNHYSDPLFVDPENHDFHLLAGSPCINGGDPNSPSDPDGSIADMGAYYYGEDDDLFLSFVEYDPDSGILPIHISTDVIIAGFQITFSGINIGGASGGLAQSAGFMISTNDSTILGFALGVINPGEGVLTNIEVDSFTGDPLCFVNTIISGAWGQPLEVATSPCINLTECPLFGDLSADGILDVLDIVAQIICILDEQDCLCGDLNGDAVVNIQDILLLVSLIVYGQ